MTFVEAAADILDREGRPLHAKEIAEKAVAFGLLSHVGKTPVQTMSAQLSAAVLKGNGPFARVRPGVFTLTKWEGKPPGPRKTPTPVAAPPALLSSASTGGVEGAGSERKAAPTAMVPKLQKVPAAAETSGEEIAAEESASQKRRKRRRKKVSKMTGSSVETISNVPTSPFGEEKASVPKSAAPAPSASVSPPAAPAVPAPSVVSGSGATEKRSPSGGEHPAEELADQVERLLRRASHPLSTDKLAEELGIGRSGHVLLEALLASDAFERERAGQRPRFVKHKSGWGLSSREVSGEILSLENQAAEIRRRLAQLAERQLLKKLRVLPTQAFIRTMIFYLECSGLGAVKPSGHKSLEGVHLSVQDRRSNGKFRTAVILRRDAPDHVLGERAVMDLRGAMHHFDAMGGIIFTTGQVSDRAIAEGRVANLPPVTVVDGETLAREMVRLGIGVKERPVSLPSFDDGFFSRMEA